METPCFPCLDIVFAIDDWYNVAIYLKEMAPLIYICFRFTNLEVVVLSSKDVRNDGYSAKTVEEAVRHLKSKGFEKACVLGGAKTHAFLEADLANDLYRAMVDKAAAVAEHQKARVDPMYHEKIDHLLDTYARKLAENMNQGFAIDARVPSVMIAGPANFPVRQKEKQNRARDGNMEEWRHIQGLLDKIRSTGMGGISADDPAAVEKLQKKLDSLERSQLIMKEVNAYYRKHGTLDGCALLSPDQIERLKSDMAASWRSSPKPFESYQLTNNNAEIRRVKARIEELSKRAEQTFSGWEFDGGHVEMNREDNRLQVFFDGKPDADTRAELKSSGFRWAPSVGAWQRQLTDNAIRAADRLECIRPLSGEKPSQLQKKPSILKAVQEHTAEPPREPGAPAKKEPER